MKLAEALQERADIARKLTQLQERLANNAIVQEGEQPAEQPEKLMKELDGCLKRQEQLVTRINITNSVTKSGDDTLTELLARRDSLKSRIAIMQDFLSQASRIAARASRSEIKLLSTVNVEKFQEQLDVCCGKLRELDNNIQMINWQTELI